MKLRPRQEQAIADLRRAYQTKHCAPILVAPTSFGKTATAAVMIRTALSKGLKVWFLAHLREILIATSNGLTAQGIRHGWIASGMLFDQRQAVQLCMIQTLAARLEKYGPPDLMIVDEAHLAIAETYQQIFKWAKAGPQYHTKGGALLLHLTATPQRLDGRGMGEVADLIVPTCSTQELIDEGLVVPIRYFRPPAGVGDDGKPKLVGDSLEHYLSHARGRPAIGFCVSNKAAEARAEAFRNAGIRAVAVSGDSESGARDDALAGIRSGRIDVVFNCKLWVAGVDAPNVSCIIDEAPTESLTRYLQGLGRGLRTHVDKSDLIVLDCVDNLSRHGDPTAERSWTLASAAEGSGRVKTEVPVKTCPRCYATVHAVVSVCGCGHTFQAKPREIEQVAGALSEIDLSVVKKQQRMEQGRAQTLQELIALGKQRGMKNPAGWARHVIRARASRSEV